MIDYTERTIELLKMLPQNEQQAAYEFIKNPVLARDLDYTKVTMEERSKIESAEKSGFVNDSDIDWKNIGKD